jgi:hypothetical protein
MPADSVAEYNGQRLELVVLRGTISAGSRTGLGLFRELLIKSLI